MLKQFFPVSNNFVQIPNTDVNVGYNYSQTFIKQPTCLKQQYTMFPNFNFDLIFTPIKQPPALGGHFCASLGWLLKTGLTVVYACTLTNLLKGTQWVTILSAGVCSLMWHMFIGKKFQATAQLMEKVVWWLNHPFMLWIQ